MTNRGPFFDEPYGCAHDTEPERIQQLEYHIETGDYFPLLSTVLGFMEETMQECETGTLSLIPMEADVIRQMRKDLVHLHTHYDILPKEAPAASSASFSCAS